MSSTTRPLFELIVSQGDPRSQLPARPCAPVRVTDGPDAIAKLPEGVREFRLNGWHALRLCEGRGSICSHATTPFQGVPPGNSRMVSITYSTAGRRRGAPLRHASPFTGRPATGPVSSDHASGGVYPRRDKLAQTVTPPYSLPKLNGRDAYPPPPASSWRRAHPQWSTGHPAMW